MQIGPGIYAQTWDMRSCDKWRNNDQYLLELTETVHYVSSKHTHII